MEIKQEHYSMLRLHNLYFDEMSFHNTGIMKADVLSQSFPGMETSASISVTSNSEFTAKLAIKIENKDIYSLSCSLVGKFEVDGGLSEENVPLRDNAIAILFPYLRSEITLLTSQPGMSPLVIPPINIKRLLESEE